MIDLNEQAARIRAILDNYEKGVAEINERHQRERERIRVAFEERERERRREAKVAALILAAWGAAFILWTLLSIYIYTVKR